MATESAPSRPKPAARLLGFAYASATVVALFTWAASGIASAYAQQVALGIATGSLYALLGLAIVLIFRSTGIVNFAQGELATLSTFVAWSLLQRFGDSPATVWLVLGLTMLLAFATGGAIEVLVMRRVPRWSFLSPYIAVLGLFGIAGGLLGWIYGGAPRAFPTPFTEQTARLGGVTVPVHTLGVMVVAAIVLALLFAIFQWTRLGLALRATAEDAVAAQLVGIPATRMLTLGWALSAAVGALAGVLISYTLSLSPSMMFNVLLFALAGAVLGGLTSPGGAVLGGLVVGVAQNIVGVTDWLGGSQLRLPWAFLLILLVLLLRPAGLFGRRQVRRV